MRSRFRSQKFTKEVYYNIFLGTDPKLKNYWQSVNIVSNIGSNNSEYDTIREDLFIGNYELA